MLSGRVFSEGLHRNIVLIIAAAQKAPNADAGVAEMKQAMDITNKMDDLKAQSCPAEAVKPGTIPENINGKSTRRSLSFRPQATLAGKPIYK